MNRELAEARGAVLTQIDALRGDLVEALQSLVRIPSVTPKYPGLDVTPYTGGETRCNRQLASLCEAAGARIDLWEEEAGRATPPPGPTATPSAGASPAGTSMGSGRVT